MVRCPACTAVQIVFAVSPRRAHCPYCGASWSQQDGDQSLVDRSGLVSLQDRSQPLGGTAEDAVDPDALGLEGEEATDATTVRKALAAPARLIAANAGYPGEVVVSASA